jgi:excisionase family DNA binding protein
MLSLAPQRKEVNMSAPIPASQAPIGYSIRNAARAVDCSERTIYNLVDAGKLRIVKVGRRSIIPASDLRLLIGEIAD